MVVGGVSKTCHLHLANTKAGPLASLLASFSSQQSSQEAKLPRSDSDRAGHMTLTDPSSGDDISLLGSLSLPSNEPMQRRRGHAWATRPHPAGARS